MARVVELGDRGWTASPEEDAGPSFFETDLRAMMEIATGMHENDEPGRWAIETRHDSRPWEVIVEPDREARVLVVVTAYMVEEP